MRIISFLTVAIVLTFSGCEQLFDRMEEQGLSEKEVINGLKTALKVGTDSSTTTLSETGGYFKDEMVKIYLPPEADIIIKYKDNQLLQEIGISQLIDDAILTMNRAAEDAADKAQPIFVDAITGMSIQDGMNILQGEDTAATHYLRVNTFDSLKSAYLPDVQRSLNKDLVGNTSTQDAWDNLTDKYNSVANTTTGQLLGLEPVNVELDAYVTARALNGLFIKVGEEEAAIRKDPYKWANDLLHRVFGEGTDS